MTTLADWTYDWLDSRNLPAKVDRRGIVYAPLEFSADGRASRELRVGRTRAPNPVVSLSVYSADRIAVHRAPQVYAACNRWNAARRLGRAWVSETDTLGVVVQAVLPVAAATPDSLRRTGDAVIASAVEFWRWADLNADW
jgi:hypothetical protein